MDADVPPVWLGVVMTGTMCIPFTLTKLYSQGVLFCGNMCLRVCIPEGELDPDMRRRVLDAALSPIYVASDITTPIKFDMHNDCVRLLEKDIPRQPFDPRLGCPNLPTETFEITIKHEYPDLLGYAQHDSFRCPEQFVLGVDTVVDFPLLSNILCRDGVLPVGNIINLAVCNTHSQNWDYLQDLGVQVMVGAHVCWREPEPNRSQILYRVITRNAYVTTMCNVKRLERDEEYIIPVTTTRSDGILRVCLRLLPEYYMGAHELFPPSILEAYMTVDGDASPDVTLDITSRTELGWLLEAAVALGPGPVGGVVHVRFDMSADYMCLKHVLLL